MHDDDEVPEYDDTDPEGDRQPYLADPEHKDIKELFPDKDPS
jgi:hypothetical protein